MKTLDDIRRQLAAATFEFSRHAFKRVVERNISELEIRQAGLEVRIIEDYPHDKYSPSCLLLGSPRPVGPCTCRYRILNPTC